MNVFLSKRNDNDVYDILQTYLLWYARSWNNWKRNENANDVSFASTSKGSVIQKNYEFTHGYIISNCKNNDEEKKDMES